MICQRNQRTQTQSIWNEPVTLTKRKENEGYRKPMWIMGHYQTNEYSPHGSHRREREKGEESLKK